MLICNYQKNTFLILGFSDEITEQLDILIQKDSRILLGNFNETWARYVFCHAFKKDMYGPKFQWLIVGMYEEEWWLNNLPPNCRQVLTYKKRFVKSGMIIGLCSTKV